MTLFFFKNPPAQFLRLCFFAGVLTGTGAFADVNVVGTWANGTTHALVAGSNRALLVFVYGEHNASFSATGVTYGTRAMTKIIDTAYLAASFYTYTSAWILKEADIAAATSSAIAVTWSATPSVGFTVESAFLTGVYQAAPIGDKASNGSNTLATITTAPLSTSSADMVFVAGTNQYDGLYTVNNGFTEAWESSGASFGDAVAGWKAATGAKETPSLTMSAVNRQTIIGFVVRGNDAPRVWNGGGGTGSWTTDANWSGVAYPRGGEEIVFDGTAQTAVNHNHTAATSYNSITFNPGAAAFTLSGNSITLTGNIINHSSNLQTINFNIATVAVRTVHTPGGNVTLNGIISGTNGGLMKDWGDNTLTLSGANTYTGITWIKIGCLSIKTIQNVSGGASNVGAPTTLANGTIWMGHLNAAGTLIYTGTGNTTNRVIDLYGTTGGATIDQSGTGLLKFTSAFTATSGSGPDSARSKTLTLQGSTAGTGEIAGAIVNPAGAGGYTTSLTKAGSGLWTLSGTSTYTGATAINAGTLNVTGGIAAGSAVTVASGATLTGTGTLAGAVTVSGGGIVAPGSSAVGTLNTGALTLSGTSLLNFECAAPGTNDKIAVTGNLTLDGTLNVTALIGFAAGTYTLLTYGTLTTDNSLTVVMPAGYTGAISVNTGTKTVVLTVTSSSGLPTILTPPADLRIYTGDSATFSVSASGTGLSYQWQRSADGTTWSNVTAGIGGTANTYKFQTLAGDANTLFHCVVSNTLGPVTSASARLKLCARITAPTDQLNKKTGDAVSFSVAPSTDVLSYSWWRSWDGITWTQIGGAAGNTYNMTVTAADTLVKFQCRMTDSCGTQTSATATLSACATPAVTVHPVSIGAIETQSARFKITATGAGRTYQWQKKIGTGAWTPVTGATSDSVAIIATKADSGAQFRCVVTNTCGTVQSNAATLTVFTKAKANFSMSVNGTIGSAGIAPASVTLADSSSGNITMWIWSWGDGAKRDTGVSRGETKTHAYANPGQYPVMLVVQGPGGRDSIAQTLTLYSKDGNPIKITGQRLTDNSVRLVFSNFSTLKAPGETSPTVSTIKLWYQAGAIPLDSTSGAKALPPYSLVTLRSGGTSYSATVNVPPLFSPNTKYGFITQIVWDNNGGTTPFDTLNGCIVLMSDTARPVNRLVVSGAYAPWDTVKFFMDSIKTIGVSSDSVGLWYGMGGDSVPDFSRTNPNVTWWSVAEIKARVVGDRFTFIKQNPRFNTDQSILRVAVVIKDVSNRLSDPADGRVTIGRVRPLNPIILKATVQPNASGTIVLTWSYQNPDTVDKIRIYYRTGSAVTVGQYEFSGLDSIVRLPTDPMTDTVKNLAGSTRYHFGAQIYKQGMWSVVTPSSSASDSTPEADAPTIRNTITVTRAVFDSATNKFIISWKIDTSKTSLTTTPVPANLLRIGFSFSTINMPQWERIGKNQRAVTSDTGSDTLDPRDSLVFDKDFYVFLWLQKTGQKWVDPTDSSTRIVPTRSFVWQAVHYNFTTTGDISLWASGQIRFISARVSPIFVRNWQDTIRAFTAPAGSAGFVSVGSSFAFAQNNIPEKFDIGLKSTLPAGRQWHEVFVYRYDATAGKWMVDRATQRDTVNGYVYVNTNQLDRPFGVFIDTQRPVVKVTDTSTAPVNKADAVNYTVEVSDNVGNLRWSFQSTKGGEPFSHGTSVDTILTNGIDTAQVTIPANQVSDDNGVIARFICDDGTYSETIDLSRQVIRQSGNSDLQWTSELKWVPLRVTAQLDSPQAKRLLRFIDTVAADPRYNDRHMRLFRWYPNASNVADKDRWVEYSKASVPDSVFDFKSGRLMWIKSREKRLLQFGRAVTMSQKVPDTVPLFARDWTDFALPYRYNMRIGDIIAAMRSAGSKYADSLQIYNWVRSSTGKYGAEMFFSSLPGKDSLARVMYCTGDNIGFTVYNPSNSVEKLVIPPISENMSAYRAANLKSAAGAGRGMWAVRILPLTADGAALTSVYCGYTANRSGGGIFYPAAPSFDGIGVSVIEEKSGRVCGHKMSGDLRGGGCSYLLMFGNGSQSAQTIRCTFERTGDFPAVMKTAVYNSQTGETVDPGNGELSVSVDGGSREYRWLFAGDAQYIASSSRERAGGKLALTSVYPNPVRRFTHVLYTLPFGRVARVDFTVLDIMGRTVWHKSIRETSVLGGRRDYVWYGCGTNGRRVAAGVYVLKMVAADSKGKAVGVFDRRLTVLP